ncbi:MAG: hypothetical protein HYV59_08890 [Planctomycetes bacterium]|nr:hypothetical protein [Planctomycetota bacterium]
MVARILTVVFCVTLLIGCTSQTIQIPQSAQNPANPSAPEAAFTPRPDWFRTDTSVSPEKPATELTPPPGTLTTTPAIYTCPMHPEVIQSSQGRCPDCGMRLIPKEPP